MKKSVFSLFLVFAVLAIPAISVAQESDELTPDQVELGEIRIKFQNVDYPSCRVDSESWDDAEYTANGRQVSLHRVNRTVQHVIKLIPNVPGFEETEIVIEPSDWKLVKLNRTDRAWRVEKQVKFKKKAVPPPKPKPVEDEPEQAAPAGEEPVVE